VSGSEPPLTIPQHQRVRATLYVIDPIARWVLKVFARFVVLELDDLRSVGKLALYNAAVRFDADLGRWVPYARQRVKGDMINSAKCESGEGRIQQAAFAALAQHLAHRADRFSILEDSLPDMDAVLNKISLASLVVQFAAGVEQAQRETLNHADEVEDYAAAMVLLHEAKATLPPELQQLVHLAFFERAQYEDIADQLNIASKTVSRRINRALDLLREYLVAHGVTHAPEPQDIDVDGKQADAPCEAGPKGQQGEPPT
jgi:RNA polymerase sigma factor (sigma-70 family)